VTNSPQAAGLVKAILRLARTFQLATVAGGVEQTAQLERLQSLGCDQIQGFLVAPPMPAKEVSAPRRCSRPADLRRGGRDAG